jgi:glycosyltransferase involved in cell wall biosynthesis
MRVLFIHFGALNVNSVIQTFHFGEEMTTEGIEVTLCGWGRTDRISAIGEPSFEVINYHGLGRRLRAWRRDPKETIVCAWTPRERVRLATLRAVRSLRAPYVVHLEDNEEYLLSSALGIPYEVVRRLPLDRQDDLSTEDLVHPTHYRELLAGAAGVTMITEALDEFNRERRPHHLARPGVDRERFRPEAVPAISRDLLGLHPEDFVLVYHGNVHYANHHEMLSLYLAVKLLQRRGRSVRLVRLGNTDIGGVDPRAFQALRDGVVEIGAVPWREIPGYLALADAYVQPGAPDAFNRYRLPSKLPEFLAMGRPVILPDCNLGHDLTDGESALLLRDGTALEIVTRVEQLLDDPGLVRRLGAKARGFALANLSWRENAAALARFYQGLIASRDGAAVAA